MNPTSSPQTLASVIDLVEKAELVRRKEDAHRLRLLAAALREVQSQPERPSVAAGRDRGATHERVFCGSQELAYRSLRAELATALTLSEYAVDRELSLADTLTSRYPVAFEALEHGHIAKEHARVLTDEGVLIGIGDDPVTTRRHAAYESEVLEAAREFTPNQLRPIAKRLAEVWAECTIEVRHREARKCRSVTVVDAGDGMADLLAHLPLVEAVAIKDRLTQVVRTVERGQRIVRSTEERIAQVDHQVPGAQRASDSDSVPTKDTEPRTRDQLRADAFVELLLESDVFALTAGCPAEAIQARVQLTAPAELTQDPDADCLVELMGYGPIDSQIGREVAAHASHWENVTTHPVTGTVLAVDRYRPSAEMKRLLGARDQTCRFPGCRVPVHRCDFDHTVDAAAQGETSIENLAALCRGHHTLKHHTDWRVEQLGGGVLRWVSPTGKRHFSRPPNVTPPKRRVQRTSVRSAENVGSSAGRAVRFEPAHPF